jgi:Zn-dependent hydrolases, including glyoxylases
MITVKLFVFNPFQVNCYVLSDETGECIVVDASCYTEAEKATLVQYIESQGLKLVKLVNTHGHVDHLLGLRHLSDKFGVGFAINDADVKLVTEAQKHGVIFGFDVEEPPVVTEYLTEGKDVTFGNSVLKTFFVPGHSPGSIAFYSPEQHFVITGDVLFAGSIGRTDLPGGDYDQLMNSIYKKLMVLPPDTEVLPGHGPFSSIHEEALNNPFLV